MNFSRSISGLGALIVALAVTPAAAQQQPTGIWIDHTGRGAVEIKPCGAGDALCGHVVWIKDAKNKSACREQILGNVRPVGAGTWDKGWIVDPDDNARYSVELKPIGQDRLRVTGYMGSKLFSETMTWRRAPADLQRCDGVEVAKPAEPAQTPAQTAAVPPASVVTPLPAPAPARTQTQAPARPSYDPTQPIEAAPLPQREVTAPVLPPIVAPAPPASTPRIAQPAPLPTPATEPEAKTEVVEDEPEAKPSRRGQRQANSKRKSGGGRECSLDLPYITVKYPCDAF